MSTALRPLPYHAPRCLLAACLLAACLLVVAALLPGVAQAAAFKAEHVIVLVVDGPRWTETWGGDGKRALIPRRAALAAQGAIYTDFANDGPTYTNAGHAALTTGVYQDIDNSGKQLPANPGLLQAFIKAREAKPEAAWLVTSKDKLEVLADTTDKEWAGKYRCATDCGTGGRGVGAGYRKDGETFERLIAILGEHHPRLVVVNFREPDSSGHANKWDKYLQGIRDTDEYVGELWDFLQKDAIFKDKTALFVTNDHGRHLDGHKDGFVSHGDDCAGCRKIELVALGPDFPKGAVIDKRRSQIDLATTVAAMLDIPLPKSKGSFMKELFKAAK